MTITVDLDTGGTFTDCFVVVDGEPIVAKALTTHKRLSEGCLRAVEEAASKLGMTREELLERTDVYRYSTTIATNALIEKAGPTLGLVTTEGFEDTVVIGKGSSWSDALTVKEIRNISRVRKPEPIIPRALTVGVKERIDSLGVVLRPLDEDDVREKFWYLVNKGVKGIVISLLWSYLNPQHEKRIREIIRAEFQGASIGSSMPVVISSDVCPKQWEYTRTVTTVLDAYLHEPVRRELAGMTEDLRSRGYKKTLMMVHNTGGMASLHRTTTLNSYSAGPVAGLVGSAHLSKVLGYQNVVLTDMGGTSFDLGIVASEAARSYEFKPVIGDWWVDVTMLQVKSIGAGGGSIAWLNPALNNRLEVGPQSARSEPGPVAYDRGGTEPTVTDADIVLGYLDPDYYHGGRMKLRKDMSIDAIKRRIGDPLGVDVVRAAALIKRVADANMANTIFRETALRGYDPKDFVVFSAGGAGPTHCCGYSFPAGVRKVVTFPFSPAFCAMGSATMDIVHFYERSRRIVLLAPETKAYVCDRAEFNEVVEGLREKALLDIVGEGFSPKDAVLSLELDMKFGGQVHVLRISSPRLTLRGDEDVRAVFEEFAREYGDVYGAIAMYPEGGVEITNFVLHITIPQEKFEFPRYPLAGPDASGAVKGSRAAFWEEYKGFKETPVYDQLLLESGNEFEGPAIVEAESTTLVVPPGTRLTVDEYLNLVIERT
ncbi:MAG: hydantoinase/oxoprolinase family protein [Thermoleophilia bacterium]